MRRVVRIGETACGKCVLLGNGCPRGYRKGERLTVYADPKEFGIKCDARVVEDKQKMRKFEKETVHDEKSGTKIESLKPVEDSLKNKAKTIPQIVKELQCRHLWHVCKECMAPCEFEGTEEFEGKWVLLSDAQVHEEQLQKEIAIQIERVKDPLQTKIEALQLAILSIYKPEIAILEKKHEELKQKIREVIEYFKAYPYYPSVIEKLEELLK